MYKGQIICCIIILFLEIFYFLSNHEKTKSSKWFSILMVISFWQLVFDILSVYTVNHLYTVSAVVNRVVHWFYMGFLLAIFYIAYKYLEAVVEEEIGERFQPLKYSAMPLLLTIFGVIFFPLYYMETSKGNYSYGPAANMVYLGVAIYLVLITRILIKHGNDIPQKKKNAFIIALLSELLVAIYQGIFFPTALITCLGITLLNLGIYITVENPDAMLVELLQKETKRADVANQAKTNFLANMSHEIRTPINAVLGMNEMILRESKERIIREYARDVQGAAKSLLSIINDILDITKIEAGKLTIIPVEYSFAGMIHDVTNMISFKAKAKELEFKVSIDDRIPSELKGDDVRIRQILVNLLNNAVKYTHTGTIALEAKLLLGEQENVARISFTIRDTGIGIKEEDISRLYIPFERIEEERNRNIEGTGLGLNITMQLLSLLDGKLSIKSEYGKGSEFSFALSQEIINPEPIGDIGKKIEADKQEYEYQAMFEAPEAKVLVVDDVEMNRKVFCSLLKDIRIQTQEAANGKECLEKVKDTAFDIIFMDHMMPEMDGIETFKAMKLIEDNPNKDTPVVILTANAIAGAREQYLSEGFDAFLSKPIDSQKLEELIKELLDESLIHYVEGAAKQSDKEEYDISKLPVIDGLDWGYASGHFKDVESMVKTIKFFASTLEYDAKELETLYAGIHEEDGRADYRIKVHGMKNSAGTIGIIPLSGMAKVLEDAARNNECDILEQLTPIFIKRWREYKEYLKVFADENGEVKNASEYKAQIDEIICKIKSAAEEMDIDALDELLAELEGYQFEEEQEERFLQIKKAIINFDVEFLQEL